MPASRRLEALRASLDGVDALLVTDPVNVRYLTGLASSNAAVLVAVGDAAPLVITDGRYASVARARGHEVVVERDVAAAGLSAAARSGIRRLGLEADHVSMGVHARLESLARGTGVGLVPMAGAVEGLREAKDEGEIEALARACDASERALVRLLDEVRPGASERVLAARLEYLICEEGGEAPAFPTILATGANSAEPHHVPDGTVLEPGDLLVIDFGARVGGYHADMTRTFVVGAEPEPWQAAIHALVVDAASAGRSAVRPGARGADVDRAARAVIEAGGHGDDFVHGVGHGVGLRIHEAPMMGASSTATLVEHAVVTVEPGVYLASRGGVRIEDTVVVGAHGARPLTTMSRDLQVLG